ncbi:MAG: CoA-binding protein [Candidatus Krumholzibacteria bacterium]|nr:CoA-binding protein [Candidatus Krumholzibacteria bacterium]
MADKFFQPENIFLVVGASNNTEKYGSKVFLDLKDAGYNVIAINKKGGEIHGTPAYPSVSDFLDKIEQIFDEKKRDETIAKVVLVFVIPPEGTLAILEEAARHGVDKAWFQPGSESLEAIEFCEQNGFAVIHDQCIMVQKP